MSLQMVFDVAEFARELSDNLTIIRAGGFAGRRNTRSQESLMCTRRNSFRVA